MNYERACELLHIEKKDSLTDVKRKYRKIMLEIHPDTGCSADEEKQLDIAEVNEAYKFLVKKGEYERHREVLTGQKPETKSDPGVWDAPINPNAYAAREVYQYAEDQNGNSIGMYVAGVGKYYWDHTTEDFDLFLRSILNLVSNLMEKQAEHAQISVVDSKYNQVKQELLYYLCSQFTDLESGLEAFSTKKEVDENGETIFYLPAMLEIPKGKHIGIVEAGEPLYPVKMVKHRLHLGRQDGKVVGYLSFPDDRVYYVLIPMFENREVKVKFEAAEAVGGKGKRAGYIRLHLWIGRIKNTFGLQENVNAKIESLLDELVS